MPRLWTSRDQLPRAGIPHLEPSNLNPHWPIYGKLIVTGVFKKVRSERIVYTKLWNSVQPPRRDQQYISHRIDPAAMTEIRVTPLDPLANAEPPRTMTKCDTVIYTRLRLMKSKPPPRVAALTLA
jgi:hypothetical protein